MTRRLRERTHRGIRPGHRPVGISGALGVLLLLGACGLISDPAQDPAVDPPSPPAFPLEEAETNFLRAQEALLRGDVAEAEPTLRQLASRCESGTWGRDALLLLMAAELSPANPAGSSDEAARLAARYLQLPGASGPSLSLAETFYLLALDLGARPVADPSERPPGAVRVALSFQDCDRPVEAMRLRELPSHPGPATTSDRLRRTAAERDSLSAVVDSLTVRIGELETELDRIRRLLAPDTLQIRPGPSGPRP